MKRLRTGDIVLIQITRFSTWYRALLGKLIQWIDRTFYHHAVIYVDGIFHEADTKVIERRLSHFDGDRVCVLELMEPLTASEESHYVAIADGQLGRKYDYAGTLIYQLLYRLTGIWIGRCGTKAERRPYCSEHALTPIHYVRGYFQDKYKWSPGDIARKGGAYYKVKWEGVFNSKEWI